MPFQPQAGESVLFPAPFVPTEHQKLVITNKRVLQFAVDGNFPVAEFPVEKIEHVGRNSERPNKVLGLGAIILGLVLLIVSVAKVLPEVLYAGPPTKPAATTEATEDGESGDGIEGRDAQDDDPFEQDKASKEGVREKANKRLKKAREISVGLPSLNENVVIGILCALGGVITLLIGRSWYRKEQHMVFLRANGIVYPIEVGDTIQQNAILTTVSAIRPNPAS
jgi:hypothetical protein